MTFANLNHTGLALDEDERAVRRLDSLIEEAEADERAKAARQAELERLERERVAATGGLSLDDLKRMRSERQARIEMRQHHLQSEAEREVLQRRLDRLQADRNALVAGIATADTEIASIRAKLG